MDKHRQAFNAFFLDFWRLALPGVQALRASVRWIESIVFEPRKMTLLLRFN
jgi:hypothetical protein